MKISLKLLVRGGRVRRVAAEHQQQPRPTINPIERVPMPEAHDAFAAFPVQNISRGKGGRGSYPKANRDTQNFLRAHFPPPHLPPRSVDLGGVSSTWSSIVLGLRVAGRP